MEPIDPSASESELAQLLDGMDGDENAERGLSFQLNSARLRRGLRHLARHGRSLWIQHLLQLLHDVELDFAPHFTFLPKGQVTLEIAVSDPSVREQMSAARVAAKEGSLLDDDRAGRMARVLCEMEPPVLLRGGSQTLLATDDSFELFSNPRPEGSLVLEMSTSALDPDAGFRFPSSKLRKVLRGFASLHPQPPTMAGMAPLRPDWHCLDYSGPWDWESVRPAQDHGFAWTVASMGVDPIAPGVTSQWLAFAREKSETPILTSLTGDFALDLRSPTTTVAASAVLGIAGAANLPFNSALLPVLHGVEARYLLSIPKAPPGIFLLADASHLKHDAFGLQVRLNDAFLEWQARLLGWAKGQVRLYLHHLEHVRAYWAERQRLRPVETGLRWKLGKTPPAAPLSPTAEQIERRRDELLAWIEG